MVSRTHVILGLSAVGFLFAGWLTYSKLIAGTCPLTEGCPYLLGLPTCVYGLVFFGIILVSSIWDEVSYSQKRLGITRTVSLIGILFAGFYSLNEVLFPSCVIKPCTYSLVIPSCIYGLALYILIYYFSTRKN